MKSEIEHWSKEDKFVMDQICLDILTTDISSKTESDEFCAVYIEGRSRDFVSLEMLAAFKSFKLFSKHNYPIFLFINKNTINFLSEKILKDWRIYIILLDSMNHEQYSSFAVKELFFQIPIENVITLHPDGFLMKNGWEDFVISNEFGYIGAHWRHEASVAVKNNDKLEGFIFPSVNVGNGGFSFRKTSKMRWISENFGKLNLFEVSHPDFKFPQEDLFFSYFGFGTKICKKPTLKQCDEWSTDPIELKEYRDKISFGFHRPMYKSQWRKCSHE